MIISDFSFGNFKAPLCGILSHHSIFQIILMAWILLKKKKSGHPVLQLVQLFSIIHLRVFQFVTPGFLPVYGQLCVALPTRLVVEMHPRKGRSHFWLEGEILLLNLMKDWDISSWFFFFCSSWTNERGTACSLSRVCTTACIWKCQWNVRFH